MTGPLRFPWRLLLLDLIGTTLIGLGMFDLLTPESTIFTLLPDIPYRGWLLTAMGLAFLLTAVRGLLAFLSLVRRR